MQLGPGLCVARVPTGGRNFEYLSGEDPVLGATLVGPLIKGIQSQNVLANAKHWVSTPQPHPYAPSPLVLCPTRTRAGLVA